MKKHLLDIYKSLYVISVNLTKANYLTPIYKYKIDEYSKKSEIIKGINEVIPYIKHPEYIHIHLDCEKRMNKE